MPSGPTEFDLWFTRELGKLLGRHPLFDLAVQSAIRHHVLGGFWFAACMFVCWTQGARPGGEKVRRRILTILFGSSLAVALAFLAGEVISWLPPSRNPALAYLYPQYLTQNTNTNSFPSQSTTLYTAVAVGVFSLHKAAGSALLVGVLTLVSLPRLYLGGHYPTDVCAGLFLGLIGFLGAHNFLESSLSTRLEGVFEKGNWLRVLVEIFVFAWILQIAVDFREVVWIRDSFEAFLK